MHSAPTASALLPPPSFNNTALQYTVMPLMGLTVARLFQLPPALAAGVCLVGTCPGGTASNLVALIAGADVALSVLLTAASTVLATAMTPLLTRALVGGVVQVGFGTHLAVMFALHAPAYMRHRLCRSTFTEKCPLSLSTLSTC